MAEIENKEVVEDDFKKAARSFRFWLVLSGIFCVVAVILCVLIYLALNGLLPGNRNPLVSISGQSTGDTDNRQLVYQNLVRRLIDGRYVDKKAENIYPMALAIDNHPDSWPAAGLARANLVIEAPVEGVTTRFLAFYADDADIDEIGPIRSARPYFIDWVKEFSAGYVHCGGSPVALAEIARDNFNDINEFYKGHLFWRAANRTSPHNVMTSTEKLRGYFEENNDTEGKYLSWVYKDDAPKSASTATATDILISDFGVTWRYNAERNNYVRLSRNKIITDAEGENIEAKNVVVQFTDMKVLDELLRLDVRTVGEGRAVTCLDGICRDGKWQKKSATARTRFYDANGEEVAFNAGTTWIEVVGTDDEVVY